MNAFCSWSLSSKGSLVEAGRGAVRSHVATLVEQAASLPYKLYYPSSMAFTTCPKSMSVGELPAYAVNPYVFHQIRGHILNQALDRQGPVA